MSDPNGAGAPARRWWLLAVFLLAVAVRLLLLAWVGWDMQAQRLGGDPADYHHIAVSLSEGEGFSMPWQGGGPRHGELVPTALRAPLLPAVLAAPYALFGPSPEIARVVLVLADAGTCVLLVLLGARLISRRIGVTAGLLAAVYPPLWINVGTIMSEALFTFTVVGTLLLADHVRRDPTPGRVTALGGSVGVMTLGRPNGLLWAALLLAWLLLLMHRLHAGGLGARTRAGWRASRRHVLATVGLFLVGVAVVVGPWVARTYHRVGVLVPVTTQAGPVLAGTYSSAVTDLDDPAWGGWDVELVVRELEQAPDEATLTRRLRGIARDWITDHPVQALRLIGLRTVRYLDLYWAMDDRAVTFTPTPWRWVNMVTVVSWWVVAALAAVGARRLWRAGALAPWWPALLVFVAFLASGMMLVAATRYRVPAEPVVVLLAAVGMTRRGQRAVGNC